MTGAQVEDGGMAPSAISEQQLQERHPSAEQHQTAGPSSTQRGSGPYTPPRNAFNDLPTPPTSHIELSASTQPPTVRREGVDEASVSQRLVNDGPSDRHDDSPSVVATARRAKRSSGAPSSSTASWDLSTAMAATSSSSTPKKHKTERDAVLQEQQEHERERRGRRMRGASATVDGADGYANINGGDGAVDDAGSSRSRTPSPITGHLSYPSALAPSPDEVKMLLYGEDQDGTEEASRPNRVAREEMQAVMDKLASMGLAEAEADAGAGQADVPRERELAAMLKKVVAHAQDQEAYIDSLERGLHTTRISSISMMSSLRTKYAHELAQELSLRSRLEAELEGAQAQAKMLSAMLARSESRNEEQDRQRAMSAEEEVMWQEEMKGHASAYAQQQAARARAAQMAQAQAQTQVRTTQTPGQAQTATARAKQNGSPGVGAGNGGLEEPFELKAEPTSPTFAATEADGEGAVTGLGISAPSTTAGPQPTPSDPALTVASGSGSGSSPLSTIIKERNKLLSDKRYLKSRMRDAEAQRDRLEAELRSMRPLLVRGAPSKSAAASTLLASAPSSSSLATPGSNAPNTPSGRSQKRDRSRRRRVATMGDAEAEHLLLAARRLRVSHARTTAGRPQSSPSKQTPLLDDDGRPRTPPPRTPRTPRTAQMSNTPRRGGHDGDATVMMTAGGSPRNGAMLPVAHHNGGGSPLARRNGASLGRWGTHERTDSMRSNGGIDELLQAAQTVLNPAERPTLSSQDRQSNSRTRGGSDAEEDEQEEEDGDDGDEAAVSRRHAFPSAGGSGAAATGGVMSMAKGSANLNNESPKRRRVSTSATVGVDLASMSPGKRIARFGTVDGKLGDGMRRLRTSTEGAEPLYHSAEEAGPMSSGVLSQSSGLSALDLLADQAAASQQPSQSSDRSHSTAEEEEDELEVRSDMSYDGMAVDGEAHSHYYPRGAYGHSYAHEESYRHMQQQPPSSQPSSQQQQQQQPSSQASGYTYSTPPLSHGWTSHQPAGPRNGVYAPRGSSPPSSGRYSTFGHGPRISSGDVHLMSAGKASLASSGSAPTLMMMMPESPKAGQKHSAQAKGGNTSPDKRLPYVRWSEEEDRKLRKAIADHGQRWEAVARVVGTRSYHQCRQRYLLMRRKEAAAKESATNNSSSGRSSGSPARHAPSATAAS